jgi:hypothetical protein
VANLPQGDAAKRYQNAEQSMESMLQRVNSEKSSVQQAMADLEAANAEVDGNLLYQLRRGGWPKQAAFVGFVLFAVRSLLDSIYVVANGDESFLAAALVQGGIALACAAFLVLWK